MVHYFFLMSQKGAEDLLKIFCMNAKAMNVKGLKYLAY
jgi:hypothetical protein